MVGESLRLLVRQRRVEEIAPDAVGREGSQSLFEPASDVHFNDRGYDLYERWLTQQLPALVPDPTS